MNSWVYAGFDETYRKLGVDFDKIYYESETYKLGKEIVISALENKVFFTGMMIIQSGLILRRRSRSETFAALRWHSSLYDTGSWNSC